MTVKDFQSGKLILLSKPFDTRGKYLNLFYSLAFILGATLFLRIIIVERQPWGLFIFILVAAFAFYLAAYRFLSKAIESEKIFLNNQYLQLTRTGFLKTRTTSYDLTNISNFRHLGKPQLSKHPLAGETFDYLGFQTEQAVINEMHGDNRLAFTYLNNTITFGENIMSWEFEELKSLFRDVIGKDLTDKLETSI